MAALARYREPASAQGAGVVAPARRLVFKTRQLFGVSRRAGAPARRYRKLAMTQPSCAAEGLPTARCRTSTTWTWPAITPDPGRTVDCLNRTASTTWTRPPRS